MKARHLAPALLATAGIAVGLGWLVLRASRPTPLVGVVHVIVGLPLRFWWPILLVAGWPWPSWLRGRASAAIHRRNVGTWVRRVAEFSGWSRMEIPKRPSP
jgi:hypothetical protein